ncbi:MAG: hypothetical protein WDZ80_03290 [Candidatus Paceibacterota bacterium]
MEQFITGITSVLISGVFAYFIALYTSKSELKNINRSNKYNFEKSLFEKRIELYKPALKYIDDLYIVHKWNEDGKEVDPYYLRQVFERLEEWKNNSASTIMSKNSKSKYFELRIAIYDICDFTPNKYLTDKEIDRVINVTECFDESLNNDTDPQKLIKE